MKKHACVLPFHHLAVRPNGKILPCCYFRWDTVPDDLTVNHPDPFNHPFMKELREKVSKDEYIKGCSQCYKDEEVSGTSMRLDMNSNEHFGLPSDPKIKGIKPVLTNIDLALSNTCNNKCRMCGPELSTSWYSDAKKIYPEFNQKGVITNSEFLDKYDLSKLEFIKLLGGEPLMEQDKLIRILEKCNLSKLKIMLITNATMRPNDQLTAMLRKLNKLMVHLSIDSYGPLNNFLRKGSNWDNVVENVNWFKGLTIDNISIHSVISIYNVNVIKELIDYCDEHVKYSKLVVADGPDWMMPRHLPTDVKYILIKRLQSYMDDLRYKKYTYIFKNLINELEKDGDFRIFLRQDIILNNLRKEHWKEYNKELYNMLESYIKTTIVD